MPKLDDVKRRLMGGGVYVLKRGNISIDLLMLEVPDGGAYFSVFNNPDEYHKAVDDFRNTYQRVRGPYDTLDDRS